MSENGVSEGGAPAVPMPELRLRLFVAGSTQRSRRAIENLQALCELIRGQPTDIEVVDIYQQPELARDYQVVAAPTLVRVSPLPVRRFVGDLSERARVLHGLGHALGTESGGG